MRTGHFPPGQARTNFNFHQVPRPGQARTHGPLSSRASKKAAGGRRPGTRTPPPPSPLARPVPLHRDKGSTQGGALREMDRKREGGKRNEISLSLLKVTYYLRKFARRRRTRPGDAPAGATGCSAPLWLPPRDAAAVACPGERRAARSRILLQGKQGRTDHFPPGQARTCPNFLKSLLQGTQGRTDHPPPGQARVHGPSSSRVSKTFFFTKSPALLPGKQGRTSHSPPGQARTWSNFSHQVSSSSSRASLPRARRRRRPPRDAAAAAHGPCLPWKRRGYPLRTEKSTQGERA